MKTIALLFALGTATLAGMTVATTLPVFSVAVLTGSLVPKIDFPSEHDMQDLDLSRVSYQQLSRILHDEHAPFVCGCVDQRRRRKIPLLRSSSLNGS
jgi:hypothetical protein